MTDIEFVALNIPSLTSGTVTKNGFSYTIPDFIRVVLEQVGNKELAIAAIYEMCASDSLYEAEKLDQYGYTKQKLWDLAQMWRSRGIAAGTFGTKDVAPEVAPGGIVGLPWFLNPPAIR